MFTSFVFLGGIVGINRTGNWKCSDWKGFLQNSCSVILPNESLTKTLEKSLRKRPGAGNIAKNLLFHKYFPEILIKIFRIPISLSVAAQKTNDLWFVSLEVLLQYSNCSTDYLTPFQKNDISIILNIWICIEVCDSNACDSIDTIV